jgi:phage shock protein PspC (stress-responsive transcriptional regulator)
VSQIDRHPSGWPPGRKLRLDKANGKLGGVCAGLAEYLGMDPLIVRLIFVLGTLIGFGSFVILYVGIWLLAK